MNSINTKDARKNEKIENDKIHKIKNTTKKERNTAGFRSDVHKVEISRNWNSRENEKNFNI